ncbi:MAG: helicase-exonuclease AddAB subunit AddB, partial [Eubacteriales bacterium]|nr:helicase-exonuclease AddAB subunit AddB [Eubacteriales bacterium]
MSYLFCFGPSGSGKSRYLRQLVIQKAQASLAGQDRTRYIFLVPEQYTMQTQRELVLDHPAHVLMNIDVLSFGRLAYRVFAETGVDRRTVLDDIGKSLLLRRAASRCAQDLQILKRGIRSPGMIDEVKSVLSEFMQYGVEPEEIDGMADYAAEHGHYALQARLRDLQTLYKEFENEKKDRFMTGEETLPLLESAIPESASLRNSVIVFDGFTGFTALQYRVVMALLRCAKEVVFSLTISNDQGPAVERTAEGGPAGGEEDLFYLTRKTVFDIVQMAKKENLNKTRDLYLPSSPVDLKTQLLPRYGKNRVLAHLEHSLFRYPEEPFRETFSGETSQGLRLFSASTPQEEVRQILGGIQEMITRTGCAYRDFAIVTADLE